MKSIFRTSVLLAVLVVMALPLGSLSVRAQGGGVDCASMSTIGLTAEDCALVQSAMTPENLAKLSSFVADYSLVAKVTGTGKNDVDVTVKGSGPISFDAAALQKGDQ